MPEVGSDAAAPVYRQACAGDHGSRLAAKPQARQGNISGSNQSAKGYLARELGPDSRIIIIDECFQKRCSRKRRADYIRSDTERSGFEGERPCKGDYRPLARGIDGCTRSWSKCTSRCDVDDPPPTLASKNWQGRASGQEHALDIDREHAVEIAFAGFLYAGLV